MKDSANWNELIGLHAMGQWIEAIWRVRKRRKGDLLFICFPLFLMMFSCDSCVWPVWPFWLAPTLKSKERCRTRSEVLDLPIERGTSSGHRLRFEMQAHQVPQHVPGVSCPRLSLLFSLTMTDFKSWESKAKLCYWLRTQSRCSHRHVETGSSSWWWNRFSFY